MTLVFWPQTELIDRLSGERMTNVGLNFVVGWRRSALHLRSPLPSVMSLIWMAYGRVGVLLLLVVVLRGDDVPLVVVAPLGRVVPFRAVAPLEGVVPSWVAAPPEVASPLGIVAPLGVPLLVLVGVARQVHLFSPSRTSPMDVRWSLSRIW